MNISIFIFLSLFTFSVQLDLGNVDLIFVNGTTLSQGITYKLQESLNLINEPSFDKTSETIFYIPGYLETLQYESVNLISSSYRKSRPNTNFILINWSYYSGGDYIFETFPNSKALIEPIAIEIKKLVDNGLNRDRMHLIGHSIGGQMAGFVGRKLKEKNVIVKRITALDPAFPGFFPRPFFDCIEGTDAEFVDIIHTSAFIYGIPTSSGTVDFWPNGGTDIQPGCTFSLAILTPESLCSHWRSWRYYAESLLNPNAFPAVQCTTYLHFLQENNSLDLGKPLVYMGANVNTSATGSYCLTTNSQSPFDKGIHGTFKN